MRSARCFVLLSKRIDDRCFDEEFRCVIFMPYHDAVNILIAPINIGFELFDVN
jgi:hypothetical protein